MSRRGTRLDAHILYSGCRAARAPAALCAEGAVSVSTDRCDQSGTCVGEMNVTGCRRKQESLLAAEIAVGPDLRGTRLDARIHSGCRAA